MRREYLLNVVVQVIHVLHRLHVAQRDRTLEELMTATPARLLAEPSASHEPELPNRSGKILRRGLLKPHQRLLVVRGVDP